MKYSPPTVLAGNSAPEGMFAEVTMVDEVVWSMLIYPATDEMTRMCWVLLAKNVEMTVAPPLAPPA